MASESDNLSDFNEEEFYRRLLIEEAKNVPETGSKDYHEFTPEPGFVFKSKVTTEDEGEKKVFVNVCTSEHIPNAKEISEQELAEILDSDDPMRYRVPLSLGEPHAEMDKGGKGCTVYDIVINPAFIKKVYENTFFKNFFLTVVFQGLEEKYGLDLERNWTVLKNKKYMGKLQSHCIRTKSKPVIMDMSSGETNGQEMKNDVGKVPLISTMESRIPEPKYTLIKEPPEGVPEFFVMEISLPGMKNMTETALDVGEDRLLLHVNPDKYHLDIELPHCVDNETCGAQFNKKTKVLTVTLAVQSGK